MDTATTVTFVVTNDDGTETIETTEVVVVETVAQLEALFAEMHDAD